MKRKKAFLVAFVVIAVLSMLFILFGENLKYTPNHIQIVSEEKNTIDIQNISKDTAYVWVNCICNYQESYRRRRLYTIQSGESIRISPSTFEVDEEEVSTIFFDIHESDIKKEFFNPIKPYVIAVWGISTILSIVIYLRLKRKRKRK